MDALKFDLIDDANRVCLTRITSADATVLADVIRNGEMPRDFIVSRIIRSKISQRLSEAMGTPNEAHIRRALETFDERRAGEDEQNAEPQDDVQHDTQVTESAGPTRIRRRMF